MARLKQADADLDPATLGDATLHEVAFADVTTKGVSAQFGADFATRLFEMGASGWQGPIASSHGVHLVQMSKRREATLPALADARDEVRREWEEDQRANLNELSYRELLGRCTIVIESADPQAAPAPTRYVRLTLN